MRMYDVSQMLVFPLFVFAALLLDAGDAVVPAKGVEGVVMATKLNVRVRPDTKYTAVAKLSKGDKVRVLRYENDWYEIAAPKISSVWISARLVENGFVVKRANLRSGPSVAFSSYRVAEPGERISVVDSSRKDWLKIAPPRGLTAWVSAKYVHLSPQAAAKLAGKPAAPGKPDGLPVKGEAKPGTGKDGGKAVAKEDKKSTATSPKQESRTEDGPLPFIGEGRNVKIRGKLIRLRSETKYVSYAVASEVNGEYFPLCYVHSGKRDISQFNEADVEVTGLQRFVKGWRRPVLDLATISSVEPKKDAEDAASPDKQ